ERSTHADQRVGLRWLWERDPEVPTDERALVNVPPEVGAGTDVLDEDRIEAAGRACEGAEERVVRLRLVGKVDVAAGKQQASLGEARQRDLAEGTLERPVDVEERDASGDRVAAGHEEHPEVLAPDLRMGLAEEGHREVRIARQDSVVRLRPALA